MALGLFGISSTIIFLSLIIAVIWIIVEVKRLKHKLGAIFLIVLIVFSYLSFFAVFNSQELDLKSPLGLVDASKIYFSWLGSVFTNLKMLTTNAIHLNWKPDNSTKVKSKYRR